MYDLLTEEDITKALTVARMRTAKRVKLIGAMDQTAYIKCAGELAKVWSDVKALTDMLQSFADKHRYDADWEEIGRQIDKLQERTDDET